MSCEHKRWTMVETAIEVSHEPGGPYLVFTLDCDDCDFLGEFSNHILNVIHDEDVVWIEP